MTKPLPTPALALLFSTTPALAQSELRYVVPNTAAGGGFMLWKDWLSFNTCIKALTRGTPTDQKMFCQDGFNGIKPRVGELDAGTTVERLESTECRDMIRVRVGTGPLKGQTGCIHVDALTSIKPE